MRVLKAYIELNTPTLITKQSYSAVIKHSTEIIPGSAVRGALLSHLYENGINVELEVNDPKIYFHPAYPVDDGIACEPAHPFVFRCKICGSIEDRLSDFKQRNYNVSDLLRSISECVKGHRFLLKPIGGSLITRKNNNISRHETRYVSMTSVAINKSSRSSEPSLIFRYLPIEPGSYEGLIAGDEERLDKLGIAGKEYQVYIGRGSSRGFGHAILRLEDVTDKYKQQRKEAIKKSIVEGETFLRAKSPVFSIEDFMLRYVPASDIFSIVNHWVTGIINQSGYSLLTNLPKINLSCANIGSLYLIKPTSEEAVEKYLEGELKGFGPYGNVGFNFLEVIKG